MFPTMQINEALLAEIEQTKLDERRVLWREAVKNAPYKMHTDRQKYATRHGKRRKARISSFAEPKCSKRWQTTLQSIF